ncbi:MAG TPA: SDR family oxidoreductase [Acidimicrobiales bacterium]|nr:SDR family oxidoreductase [Acidimicrobiales bacterium]
MPFAPFDLTGHVALVTGGNGGIGLGMAEGLAQAGADVAIWGTNEQKNNAAAAQLEAHGTRVLALRCDVGDEEEVDAAFAATVEALGKVDSCFANAGVGAIPSKFTEAPTDEWRRVLRVNLDGAFFTLRAAARHMVERGEGGSLVATSSLSAIEGAARNEGYAATKGALVAMIRALSVEFAPDGIRANTIVPGWIETGMTDPLFNWDRFRDNVLPRIPTGRWGAPRDFAGIAVYLASPASAFHTGDTLVIDGAYSLY